MINRYAIDYESSFRVQRNALALTIAESMGSQWVARLATL
jgi:hypothetical protein